jgi:hypothetical protein
MGAVKGEATDRPRRRGRPRKVSSEALDDVARLRAEGVVWRIIGLRLGLNPETCRRALWAVKKASRAVENPPRAVNNSQPEG